MTWDPSSQMVLLFGGETSDPAEAFPATLWGWDGNTWSLLASDGPPGRRDAELGYDAARRQVILYGGRRIEDGRPQALTDTWAWDGARWHELSGTDAGMRIHFSMASGIGSDSVTLFGGADDDSPIGQRLTTNGWAGSNAALPGDRFPIAITSSNADGALPLLLAGASTNDGIRAEVWEWRQNEWSRRDSAGPQFSPRGAAAATADGLLFHLGWEEHDAPAATWLWSAERGWRQLAGNGPGRRRGTAMAWDAERGRTMLYGGEDAGGLLGDLWIFDGSTWQRVR